MALVGLSTAEATTVTFDGAAAGANADIPLNYGSYVAGNATGFVTTDGTGATPNIELTWLGNRPNEWEYHNADTWVHEIPVNVAQMDFNRGSDFDDIAEIVFAPIDGRAVRINSFLLSGANNMNATATFDWEVVGQSVGGKLNIDVASNTGTVPVNFTGAPGTAYTLRFTHLPGADSSIGVALDNLSFSEVLLPGAEVLRVRVDRVTGAITMLNTGTSPATIKGYSLTSEAGALNHSQWKSIAGNYDFVGDKSVDPNDDWSKLSPAASAIDFSEYEFGGNGATIPAGASIVLSKTGGGAWLKSPVEDLAMEVAMGDGRLNRYTVEYVNGPAGGFTFADLNFDGTVNALDWPLYNAGRGADLSSLSGVQAYRLGDLDGDHDNDIADFVLFKELFVAANGQGSFEALLAVPEPTALLLAVVGLAGLVLGRSRNLDAGVLAVLALGSTLTLSAESQATTITFDGSPAPASNSDLPKFYGSNIAGNAPGFITTDGTGATPNIGLTWAPTGGTPNSNALDADVLEFHSGATFAGAGFSVPVLQFDVDLSGHPSAPDDPTVDFTVTGGFSLKLNSFQIGNATDQNEAPYRWNINLIRLSDMATVATRTTGFLSAGSLELVNFDYTGDPNESYRLQFDDEGANRVRTGIDNFSFSQVIVNVPVLKLVVNTLTGATSIVNESGSSFDIDSYEITSASQSLKLSSWNSLQDQDFEQNGAPGAGNGWEEAGGVGAHQVIESYLLGSSTLSNGMNPISLGNLYDHSKPGAMQDLKFSYHDAGSGAILRVGAVEYVQIRVDGDYNNDGVVDAADYTVWRDTNGQSGAGLAADGSGNGAVGPEDYTYWRARYGSTGSSQSAAVPEPTAAGMAMLLTLMGLMRRRRSVRLPRPSALVIPLVGISVLAGGRSDSFAGVTIDRLYLFGDHASEPATAGGNVGAALGETLDSQSQTGSRFDSDAQNLTPNSTTTGPKYVNVGPTGLNRPGAAAGQVGAQFDGINDVLWGAALNRPDETGGPSFVGNGPLLFPFPYNYDQITARGLQLWVYPDADAIGTRRQGIVFDTIAAGGVAISADGKWTQVNDSIVTDGVIGATVPVVGNQWQHVMHHIFRTPQDSGANVAPKGARGDAGFTSVVFVNGIAVSANNGTPRPGELDNGDRIGVLAVGAEEIATVDFVNPVFENYFKGKVDNLEMYVYGDNSSVATSPAGQNYGEFDLFSDNDWIASQIGLLPGGTLLMGDINRDGAVNGADINAMGAGWLKERRLKGSLNDILVGDWQTWGWGDLNLDGVVSLPDAIILNDILVSIGGPSISFSLLVSGQIPEPSAALLVVAGIVGLAQSRRR